MKTLFTILLFLTFFKGYSQLYQAMPAAGYGPVSRMLFNPDGVLTIPIGLGGLRNISGGKDTGQIRYNPADSSMYTWTGFRWKAIGSNAIILTEITGELADSSNRTTITLTHIAIFNTVKLIKNGQRLPPFKFSVLGAIITLTDPRISTDIFLTDYKF